MSDALSMSTHEYILCLSDKGIRDALYDLGTMFDYISAADGIPVFRSSRLQKEKSVPGGVFGFFLSAELIDGATFRLTSSLEAEATEKSGGQFGRPSFLWTRKAVR